MIIKIIEQKKLKLLLLLFFASLFFNAYIYAVYNGMKKEHIEIAKDDLLTNYSLYKKAVKTKRTPNNILIANQNYIDNQEFLDEMRKSTPLLLDTEDKLTSKYSLTIKFFNKENKLPRFLQSSAEKLVTEEYDIELKDTHITLFGIIPNKGYVLMGKSLNYHKLQKELDTLFMIVVSAIVINAGLFFFLVNLINVHQNNKLYLEQMYKKLQEDTRNIAFKDKLTGAATRLKFDETLKDLIQIAYRFEEQRFALIIFDIDNFKNVNDTLGHDYGDIVLKNIASAVQKHIRKSDTFARWGGEEFVILLPLSDLEHGNIFANKLRLFISKVRFERLEKVTCSFGVVEYQKGDTEKSIIKRAIGRAHV